MNESNLPGSAKWIEEHNRGITASDAGVACGLGKHALPKNLWEVKTGKVERYQDDNIATAHGIESESVARDFYVRFTHNEVTQVGLTWHTTPDLQFLGASPDGIVTSDLYLKTNKPLLIEIKCPFYVSDWEFIPVDYMPQMQLQMEVFDIGICDFICYFKQSKRVKIWRVFRNKLYWKWMESRLRTFWNCVKNGVEPTENDIPSVYYDVTTLVKNDYRMDATTSLPRRVLPPKVHSMLVADTIYLTATEQKILERNRAILFWKKWTIRILFVSLTIVVFLLSMKNSNKVLT